MEGFYLHSNKIEELPFFQMSKISFEVSSHKTETLVLLFMKKV